MEALSDRLLGLDYCFFYQKYFIVIDSLHVIQYGRKILDVNERERENDWLDLD